MAIAKSLVLLMKLRTEEFQSGLRGAERSAARAADSIDRSGKKAEKSWQDVGSAVTSLKGLFAGFVTATFFKQIADVVAGNEKVISSFRAITDNAEQARAVFDTFNNLSRELPQSFDEIRQSVLTLGKSGIMPTTDLIKDLSNIAAGTGKSLTEVSQAVYSATAGQLRGLQALGIQAEKSGDKIKVSFKGSVTEIANTKQAMLDYVSSISKSEFAGAAESQMQGLTGAIKNVGDAWGDFLFALGGNGNGGLGEVITQAVWIAVDALDSLSNFINNNQWFQSITSDLARFMTDFRNGLKYITTEAGAAIDEITGSVGDSSGTCGDYVSTFFNNFFSLLKIGVTMVTAAVMSALKTIKAAIATAGTALISFAKSTFNVLTTIGDKTGAVLHEVVHGDIKAIGDTLKNTPSLSSFFDEGFKATADAARSEFDNLFDDVTASYKGIKMMIADTAAASVKADEAREARLKRQADALKSLDGKSGAGAAAVFTPGTSGGKGSAGKSAKNAIDSARKTWESFFKSLKSTGEQAANALLTPLELENKKYQDSLAQIKQFYDAGTILASEYHQAVEMAEKAHQDRVTKIKSDAEQKQLKNTTQARLSEKIQSEYGYADTENGILAFFTRMKDVFGDKTLSTTMTQFTARLRDMTAEQQAGVWGQMANGISGYFETMKNAFSEGSAGYKTMFVLQKSFAIASATLSMIQGAMEAWKLGFPAGLIAGAGVLAQGANLIALLRGTNFSGAHYDGSNNPPGMWGTVSEKGAEMVNGAIVYGAADIKSAEETDRLINQGKQSAAVSVSVNLYEDASKAGQVQQNNSGDVINIFVSNIRRGGDAAQVLQSSYGLKRVGV
mgnify:FL=1